MQTLLNHSPTKLQNGSQAAAQQGVTTYIHAHVDPSFQVATGTRYHHKTLDLCAVT